ncbi:hypothetical protein K493DRAFT_75415 [Basidiobolus meristosporus CBS 931.73]|uniref:DDE-1 domain-containing protein n=1 Tax=Basidiobolus meristosporus CBS 931.73 TaxID=1314790 RepID=A0A1Y1YYU6_9FUNG|nr:hypothetical protein K493DRAFT_75415 [Basidiobolus meristosporus CBS 931.73]|eukprot:ORY03116.1 hypothetical protein K493DRAFT_75415 [Basidiobolus meristosporus CBS 931.73]
MTITPMKSGILRDFRARFKHSIVSRLAQLAAMDCTQSIIRLDLIDALMLVTQSWHGLSTAVIQDSWNVTKIVSQQQGSSRSVLQLPSMDSISVDTQAILDRLKCVAPATYAAFLALPECPETSNQQCPLILDNHHVVSEPHDSSATSNADSEDPAALQTTTQSFQHAINTCGLNPARDIGQQRLYSDQEAREAIRNLCLYFCYRTHSDAGARLMLEAEKLLEEELRNTRTSEPESTEQP